MFTQQSPFFAFTLQLREPLECGVHDTRHSPSMSQQIGMYTEHKLLLATLYLTPPISLRSAAHSMRAYTY